MPAKELSHQGSVDNHVRQHNTKLSLVDTGERGEHADTEDNVGTAMMFVRDQTKEAQTVVVADERTQAVPAWEIEPIGLKKEKGKGTGED